MSRERAPHILVVEDNRDLRDSMIEALQDQGYSVAPASDGLRALEYLSSSEPKPDLILLDLMMPNMNGFQFREEQLKNAEHASIPVAVLSADEHTRDKAARLQTTRFVRKPLRVATLLDLVTEVLGTESETRCDEGDRPSEVRPIGLR